MKIKSLAMILLIAVLALAFVSCGNKDKENDSNGTNSESSENNSGSSDSGSSNNSGNGNEAAKDDWSVEGVYAKAVSYGYNGTLEEFIALVSGKDGINGKDGLTPFIGENGNWWIGEKDTGVKAEGKDGEYSDTCEHIWVTVKTLKFDCLYPDILKKCEACEITKISHDSIAPAHTYDGEGICTVCNERKATEGLVFTLQENGEYYVTSFTNMTAEYLIIPEIYEGIAVTGIDGEFSVYENVIYVSIPKTVVTIDKQFLNSLSDDLTFVVDNENPVYMTYDSVLYTKDGSELIRYYGATENGVFYVPAFVKKIGYEAFRNASDLLFKVVQSDYTEELSLSAFYSSSITDIVIGASVNKITGTFANSPVKNITVSSENEVYCAIDNVLYSKDQKSLIAYPCASENKEFAVADHVEIIEEWAFGMAYNLNTIIISDSVKEIKNNAFYSCDNLSVVNIGKGVEMIGNNAFSDCTSLKTVQLGESVRSIGKRAFSGCSSLESIVIDKNIDSIGENVFDECTNLKAVYYEGSISEWNNIEIGADNDSFVAVTRFYYSEEVPSSSGNYWHYNENGEITVW